MIKVKNKVRTKMLSSLPFADLEVFSSIDQVLEVLETKTWGFIFQNQSSINGKGKYLLRRKNIDSKLDLVCLIESYKDDITITLFTIHSYSKKRIIDGAGLL